MLLLPLPIENNIYINSDIVLERNFFKFAGNLYSYKWVSLNANVCCLIFHNKLSDIFILPVCFACLNILEWDFDCFSIPTRKRTFGCCIIENLLSLLLTMIDDFCTYILSIKTFLADKNICVYFQEKLSYAAIIWKCFSGKFEFCLASGI